MRGELSARLGHGRAIARPPARGSISAISAAATPAAPMLCARRAGCLHSGCCSSTSARDSSPRASSRPWSLPGIEPAPQLWREWIPMICGVAVIVGHIYPVWYGFRGGKGVATLLGVLLGTRSLAARADARDVAGRRHAHRICRPRIHGRIRVIARLHRCERLRAAGSLARIRSRRRCAGHIHAPPEHCADASGQGAAGAAPLADGARSWLSTSQARPRSRRASSRSYRTASSTPANNSRAALGITRSAVWKAAKALRDLGVSMEAVRNRGYRVANAGEPLDAAAHSRNAPERSSRPGSQRRSCMVHRFNQ